jgi:peptide/nickel transport system permease protein
MDRERFVRRRPLPPPIEPSAERSSPAAAPLRARLRRGRHAVFGSNPALVSGLALLGGFAGATILALLRYGGHLGALSMDPAYETAPAPPGPTAAHPFGVLAHLGVDEASALLQATPWDLALIGGAIVGAAALGGWLGAWEGLRHPSGEGAARWTADTVASVPPFFLALAVMFNAELVLPRAIWVPALVAVLAAILAAQHVRPVAAAARGASRSTYAEAARAAGAGTRRLLYRHVWPNALYPSLAQVPVDVFNVFFLLTAFPFVACVTAQSVVGFSYANPLPSFAFPEWGFLLASGVCYGFSAVEPAHDWWMWLFPTAVLIAFGATVVLLCDGVSVYLRRSRR